MTTERRKGVKGADGRRRGGDGPAAGGAVVGAATTLMSLLPGFDLAAELPAARLLLAAAGAGKLAQSLLITGPPGVGKGAIAMAVGQALLCTSAGPGAQGATDLGNPAAAANSPAAGESSPAAAASSPCGVCRACRLAAADRHPDLHLIAGPLRVDAVRTLQGRLSLSPTEGVSRVAVLPNIESASPGAANSLLKTLEEPPGHVTLILTTDSPTSVLATIRSRCQSVAAGPMSRQALARVLAAGYGLTPEAAELLASLAGGRLAWAVRAAGDESFLLGRERWLAELHAGLAGSPVERLQLAGRLAAADGVDDGLVFWRSWARDLILAGQGVHGSIVNVDRADELAASAQRFGIEGAVAILRAIETSIERIAANVQRQLALEALLLELPR